MPIDMRLPKLRGNTSADAMPIGPFRTYSQPVNVRDLEARFDAGAEVTPEALVAAGVLKNTRTDVKILGVGELTKALSVSAHGFSASARGKIEAAGGSVVWLRGEPVAEKPKTRKARPAAAEQEEPEAAEAPAEAEEPAEDDS
jgi:large subunit ribosomal protein L15